MFQFASRGKWLAGSLCLALAGASVAQADVKDGVDAWSRGDFATAVAEWQGPAARGDADAQFNLAQAYRLGRGVEPDIAKARELYERAAASGHVKAADNYGLLLFQQGERPRAMPYINAAAMRGDPRAQYVLGLAYFNGDLAEKDWVKAYALMTLANAASLPQAADALKQMDEYIPMEDRQSAQLVGSDLKRRADENRAAQLAAVDLGVSGDAPVEPSSRVPSAIASLPVPASTPRAADTTAATAGADYARPAQEAVLVAGTIEPASQPEPAPAPVAKPPASSDGPWRVQLGAFGVKGNAERLWGKLSSSAVLGSKKPIYVPAGKLTKLQAGGFATQGDAARACAALKSSGQACIVTK